MFEKVNTLNATTTYNNDVISKGYNVAIQLLVESYLKNKEEQSMNDFLKSKGVENLPGVIYNYHLYVLQIMLNEELMLIGTDLESELKKKGFEFKPGELSELEMQMIGNKLGTILALIDFGKKLGNK